MFIRMKQYLFQLCSQSQSKFKLGKNVCSLGDLDLDTLLPKGINELTLSTQGGRTSLRILQTAPFWSQRWWEHWKAELQTQHRCWVSLSSDITVLPNPHWNNRLPCPKFTQHEDNCKTLHWNKSTQPLQTSSASCLPGRMLTDTLIPGCALQIFLFPFLLQRLFKHV